MLRRTVAVPQDGVPILSEVERLLAQLKMLSPHARALVIKDETITSPQMRMSCTAFQARLIDDEIATETECSINTQIGKVGFQTRRTLEEFDFSFQPSLSVVRSKKLAGLDLPSQGENIVLVSRPEAGKTHLSIDIALRACQAHKRVLFIQAADLRNGHGR